MARVTRATKPSTANPASKRRDNRSVNYRELSFLLDFCSSLFAAFTCGPPPKRGGGGGRQLTKEEEPRAFAQRKEREEERGKD